MTHQKQIKGKMGAVKNVQKMTRTMEAVSASKMKRAIDAALLTREYARLSLELLKNLSQEEYLSHPLLKYGNNEKTLIVMYSSNKGLCGSFNMTIARSVWKYIQENKDVKNPHFIAVGKHSEKFVRKTQRPLIATFTDLGGSPDAEKVISLSKLVLDEFKTGDYKRVVILYANFVSALQYEPVARKVLPVKEKVVLNMLENTGEGFELKEKNGLTSYMFEPDEEQVLEYVLEKLVEVMLYQALLESLASEHSARRSAMKMATDNAGQLHEKLQLQYNRARQSAITQEIAEISAGAEAIK